MGNKVNHKVLLVGANDVAVSHEFELPHAARILAMGEEASGWVLPPDSPYEFVNGELIRKKKAKE